MSYAKVFDTLLTSQRSNGVALSGGKVYFYVPGTNTLKTIYSTRNKTVAANPYTLSANGTATLYGDGLYDVQLKTAASVDAAPLWEDVLIMDSLNDRFIYDFSSEFVSLADAATNAAFEDKTIVITSPQVVTTAITWPADRQLQFEQGGYVTFNGSGALTGLKEARPEWFGVNTTPGTTDMTTAVVRASNSLVDGGVLKFIGTTYLVNEVTITNNNINLASDSISEGGPIIKSTTASGTIFNVNAGGVTFKGLRFDGDGGTYGASATVTGIKFRGTDNTGTTGDYDADGEVQNCTFYKLAVGVRQTGKNVRCNNNLFSNSLAGIKVAEDAAVSDFRGLQAVGNRFHSLGGSSIAAWGVDIDATANFAEVLLSANHFDDCNGAINGFSSNMVITGNTLTRMYGGIIINATGHGVSAERRAVIVSNNNLNFFALTSAKNGIQMTGTMTGSVTGNTVIGAGQHGVYLNATGSVSVSNNYVRSCGNTGAYDAIHADATTTGCRIENNSLIRGTATSSTGYGLSVVGYGASLNTANYIGKQFVAGYAVANIVNIVRSGASHNIGDDSPIANLDVVKNNAVGNTDATIVVGQDSPNQRHTTAITADRTITLSDTNVYDGAVFKITRISTGAFNLNINNTTPATLKALATNTWAEFIWSGQAGAWVIRAYGAL